MWRLTLMSSAKSTLMRARHRDRVNKVKLKESSRVQAAHNLPGNRNSHPSPRGSNLDFKSRLPASTVKLRKIRFIPLGHRQRGSTRRVTSAEKDVGLGGRGGGTGRGGTLVGRKVQAEARDDGISAVTSVLCQQAAAGVSKCAICDRVSHAIIACTAATDDENMPECMTPAATDREESAGNRTLVYLKGPAKNSRRTSRTASDSFIVKMHSSNKDNNS